MASARRKACMLGALLADASTMPLHWIYDVEKLAEVVGDKRDAPEFFATPSCPFYGADRYPTGILSPYGDEVMVVLKSMAANGGKLDGAALGKATSDFGASYDGRLNHMVKEYMEAVSAGKGPAEAGNPENMHAHSITKVPLIVARYAGQPEMMDKVVEAVSVHQTNPVPLENAKTAAVLLEKIVLGSSIAEAIEATLAHEAVSEEEKALVKAAVDAAGESLADVAGTFGRSCKMPGAYQVVITCLQQSKDSGTYESAIRSNILAGGDNCSRAILLGGMMAASAGEIPEAWASQVEPSLWKEISELAAKVLDG